MDFDFRFSSAVRKLIISLFLAFNFTFLANSQTNNYADNLNSLENSLSPNAWSFIKFTEHPVDYYTGTPDIGVDLYTVMDGSVKVPIRLTYNASGIKVDEEASWVGLGWNLSVGGVLTEIINGSRDNSSSYPYDDLDDFMPTTSGMENYGTSSPQGFNSIYPNARDGHYNPDVFVFNFFGYSGKFVFDHRTNQPRFLDRNKHNLKIVPLDGNTELNEDGWKIIDANGVQYFFEYQEYIQYDGSIGDIKSISNYLTKVIYPDGGYIQFEYETLALESKYAGSEELIYDLENACGSDDLKNYTDYSTVPYQNVTIQKYAPVQLTSMSTQNIEVLFETSARDDLYSAEKLDKIIVQNNDELNKREIVFDYSYFNASTVGGSVIDVIPNNWTTTNKEKKLKLNSVTTDGVYSFNYFETYSIPQLGSRAQDHWGYYNGKNNTSSIPKLKYVRNSTINRLSGTSNIPTGHRFENLSWGGWRGADIDYAVSGMLKMITYPTKGSTTYNYELNEFSNYSIPDADYETQTPSLLASGTDYPHTAAAIQ